MKHDHRLATTTDTLELRQLREINRRMAEPGTPSITAQALGLHGSVPRQPAPVTVLGVTAVAEALPKSAVLVQVTAAGPPECPYFTGHFSRAGDDLTLDLHTATLNRLSQRLDLQHHRWGC